MKKAILSILFTFFILNILKSQITKGYWLVGGNGKVSISKSTVGGAEYKTELFSISPNIGYFIFDKFSTGLRLSLDFTSNKYIANGNGAINYSARYTNIVAGPFARYYILNREKSTNVFIEAAYQVQTRKVKTDISPVSKENGNIFSVIVGPVIYFNSVVGIEFVLGYSHTTYKDYTGSLNTFLTGIGLQIHLKKMIN